VEYRVHLAQDVNDMTRHSTEMLKLEVVVLGQPQGSEVDLNCGMKT
jgi:hypothetical protein